MRLPWLQIDADGQTRARMLARLLGVPEPQGLGIALALWTWALEMAPDGDFSGEVAGDVEIIAAAVSWPMSDVRRLLTELQRVGFIAMAPKLRVRGLERYRRAWEKNRRRTNRPSDELIDEKVNSADSGGTLPVTGANPAPTRAEPARKTETETEKKELLTLLEPPTKPPKREPKPSAAQEFFAWLAARRAARTPLSDEPLTARGINSAFGRVLVDYGRPTLERCYLAFLDEPDGAAKAPPWPWRSFLARLPMLARRPAATPQTESRAL